MILQLKQIQKNYPQFSLHCSLEVREGCITGFIGQNGAGKSTVFKGILELITLDSGEIKIFGKPLNALTPKDKEAIGVVLSDSGFHPALTPKDITGIMRCMHQNFDQNGFLNKCEQFDLPLTKRIGDFSTGMKAKLKILAATSYNAKLLLLDEPTSGLDVLARDEILDMLRTYMDTGDRSILISSHISSDLEGLCDDLYMIHQGKVIFHEDTDVLLDHYGLMKLSQEDYQQLDKQYITAIQPTPFGYNCLTSRREFYLTNDPHFVIEKGAIDNVITMLIKGEKL